MTGLPVGDLQRLFAERSDLVKSQLRLGDSPFTFERESVLVSGIAGIVRLAPGVEVEIVPKCFNPNSGAWRDDFLFMATVTKLGRIFRREHVSASRRERHGDLLSLLAAIFLEEFERLSRIPIREYRRSTWTDLNIDGELDYADLWETRPEGFVQTAPRLTANNQFMGMICEAASYLGSASIDRGVGQRLQRLAAAFPWSGHGRVRERVPGRYARWQELYDLARDVLQGHGMQLEPNGGRRAPGFIVKTEKGWEELLRLAFATQRGALQPEAHTEKRVGTRHRPGGTGRPAVNIKPDYVLNPPSFGQPLIVDAKYKGSPTKGTGTIASADLYQILAYCRAYGSTVGILVYPASDPPAAEIATGAVRLFEEIVVDSYRVIGATVNTQGIGRTHGFADFGRALGQGLLGIAGQGAPEPE